MKWDNCLLLEQHLEVETENPRQQPIPGCLKKDETHVKADSICQKRFA